MYHIGLPLISPTDKVLVQLSKPSEKGLKLLDLCLLADVLKRDPNLSHIADGDVAQIIQTLFVATGCDYVSFFSGIGKNFFYHVFLSNAMFIMADHPRALCTAFESKNLYEQAQSTLRCLLIVSTKFSVLEGACIWLVLILAILQVGCLSEIHVYSR